MPPYEFFNLLRPTVYILRDRDDEILYIGVTGNIHNRIAYHRQYRKWFALVADIELIEFTDSTKAAEVEVSLIREHNPRFNTAHNWGKADVGRYGKPNKATRPNIKYKVSDKPTPNPKVKYSPPPAPHKLHPFWVEFDKSKTPLTAFCNDKGIDADEFRKYVISIRGSRKRKG